MNRQRLLPAAALLAAVSVSLTACGGGDDGGGEADSGKKVAGADAGSPEASKSPSPSASTPDPKAPDLSLPKDVKVVQDWREPADKAQAAALAAAVHYLTAINRAIALQDVSEPAYLYYSYPGSAARTVAQKTVKGNITQHYSIAGTERMHRQTSKVSESGESAAVSLCTDDSKFYSKNLKTGKTEVTEPGADDHTWYELGLVRSTGSDGVWVVKEIQAKVGAEQCQ
ncbi:hypothetical protein [Streptomyces sp. NPDC007088]|uniref:hypothetical protein n=1 Tax=Streptomyces sp. NPDC007088 TaxID=3364773 RepID=UPI0036B19188